MTLKGTKKLLLWFSVELFVLQVSKFSFFLMDLFSLASCLHSLQVFHLVRLREISAIST